MVVDLGGDRAGAAPVASQDRDRPLIDQGAVAHRQRYRPGDAAAGGQLNQAQGRELAPLRDRQRRDRKARHALQTQRRRSLVLERPVDRVRTLNRQNTRVHQIRVNRVARKRERVRLVDQRPRTIDRHRPAEAELHTGAEQRQGARQVERVRPGQVHEAIAGEHGRRAQHRGAAVDRQRLAAGDAQRPGVAGEGSARIRDVQVAVNQLDRVLVVDLGVDRARAAPVASQDRDRPLIDQGAVAHRQRYRPGDAAAGGQLNQAQGRELAPLRDRQRRDRKARHALQTQRRRSLVLERPVDRVRTLNRQNTRVHQIRVNRVARKRERVRLVDQRPRTIDRHRPAQVQRDTARR